MAVEHMVWIKFKPGISQDRIQQHLDSLASLKGIIPQVVDLKVGENFTDRANGFTHGMIVTFKCRGCLETYLPHPEHVKVAQPLREDAELMAMDIES